MKSSMKFTLILLVTIISIGLSGISAQANIFFVSFFDETKNRIPPITSDTFSTDMGDVDGDGDLDIVVGKVGQDLLMINQGKAQGGAPGTYVDETSTRMPSIVDHTNSVYLVDVDRDGDMDIFSCRSDDATPKLLINKGINTGKYEDDTANRLPENSRCNNASFGDVDNDGDPDFVSVDGIQYTLMINQNDSSGVFLDETAKRLPALPKTYHAGVALGDLDQDGNLDIFLANGGPNGYQQNNFLINDGSGIFHDVTLSRLPSVLDNSNGVELGDVDGDGAADILVFNTVTSERGVQNRLLINDGRGNFLDETATRMPIIFSDSRDGDLKDINNDGVPDIILASLKAPYYRILINDGSGRFNDESAPGLPAESSDSSHISVGDVDNDGDPDLLFASQNKITRLLINTPQTARRYHLDNVYVQHSVQEGGTSSNHMGFKMRSKSVGYPEDNILTAVTLRDPAGQIVPLSGPGFSSLKKASGNLDEWTGEWLYSPKFRNENFYSAKIKNNLLQGTYHFQVKDINGVTHDGYYEVKDRVNLPVVKAASFETHFDGRDFIWQWEMPDLSKRTDPLAVSVSAVVKIFKDDTHVGEIEAKVPSDVDYLSVPKYTLGMMQAQGNRIELGIRLATNDNNNRTVSEFIEPQPYYINSRYVQHRRSEDGRDSHRLAFQFSDYFGNLVPSERVMSHDTSFALLKAKEKGVLPTNIGSWSPNVVAYGLYDGVAGYYSDGLHDENAVFEEIGGVHDAGTYKLVVSDINSMAGFRYP